MPVFTRDGKEDISGDYRVHDMGVQEFIREIKADVLKALKNPKERFPKELAYVQWLGSNSAEHWISVEKTSPQTKNELKIIAENATKCVSGMEGKGNGRVALLDLGAADSPKYRLFLEKLQKQGFNKGIYVPVDLIASSVKEQLKAARAEFPQKSGFGLELRGLCGPFDNMEPHFDSLSDELNAAQEEPQALVICSFGSILLNGPRETSVQRLQELRSVLGKGPQRIAVFGQDCMHDNHEAVKRPYKENEYENFMREYLRRVNDVADIKETPKETWNIQNEIFEGEEDEYGVVEKYHYFKVTAKKNLVCRGGEFKIPAGTSYKMFESWKVNEEDVAGLIRTAGGGLKYEKIDQEGTMVQYKLWVDSN